MHLNRGPIPLALIALNWARGAFGQSSEGPPAKPSSCDGVLMVHGEISHITGTNGKPLDQFVGNLTYSLAMNGTLSLTSTVPTWHCTPIQNRSNSTSAMRTLPTTFASAQLVCNSDVQDIDAPWLTQWTKVAFFGQVFVSIIAHDGICASPPTLLSAGSSCTYNATSDGGLRDSSDCKWTAKADIHYLGDKEKEGEESSEE